MTSSIDDYDYDEIERAVLETDRGRWFLTEFAKRNRKSETDLLLNSIERLERALLRDTEYNITQNFTLRLSKISEEIDLLLSEAFPFEKNKNDNEIITHLTKLMSQESLNLALTIDKIRDQIYEISNFDSMPDIFGELNNDFEIAIKRAADLNKFSKNITAFSLIYTYFRNEFDSLSKQSAQFNQKNDVGEQIEKLPEVNANFRA